MEMAVSSETLLPTYQATRRHILEDSNIQIYETGYANPCLSSPAEHKGYDGRQGTRVSLQPGSSVTDALMTRHLDGFCFSCLSADLLCADWPLREQNSAQPPLQIKKNAIFGHEDISLLLKPLSYNHEVRYM
jgi:hypothetical protein